MASPEQQLAEVFGADFPDVVRPVGETFARFARETPHAIAVVSAYQPANLLPLSNDELATQSSGCLRWTYSQLKRRSDLLAKALMARGVSEGMPIGCALYSGAEYALVVWTAFTMHCPLVLFNPALPTNVREIQHMLKLTQPAVLIVPDESFALQIEASLQLPVINTAIKILASSNATDNKANDWLSLANLLNPSGYNNGHPRVKVTADHRLGFDDVAVVFFTSGTTSLPKACAHTNSSLSFGVWVFATTMRFIPSYVMCNPIPAYHAFGTFFSIFPWLAGATVCYPSATFNPSISLKTIEAERCTHMPSVPTMVIAMVEALKVEHHDTSSLEFVGFAGTAVSPNLIRTCISQLKVRRAEVFFAMSEVAPVTVPFDSLDPPMGDSVSCGPPCPRTRIKMCLPDQNKPVRRGELGEMHVSGEHIIAGYIGIDSPSFYDEDGVRWFKTGDQGFIDDDGHIHIGGRYKDMIIRAGHNIAPAAIEEVLDSLTGAMNQVVGTSDEIAGEVPVAIIQDLATCHYSKFELSEGIREKLGTSNVPAYIFTLSELSLADWPRTTSGKIRKTNLREVVCKHLEKAQAEENQQPPYAGSVQRLWSALLGAPIGLLSESTDVHRFADSIMLMQFSNQVMKEMGIRISFDELLHHRQIGQQVALISQRKKQNSVPQIGYSPKAGPLGVSDIISAHEDLEIFEHTRGVVQQLLERYSLRWEDVEDVLPAEDWARNTLYRTRDQANNMRFIYKTRRAGPETLRPALAKMFAYHPFLRTMAILEDDLVGAQYVVVRSSEKWYKHTITTASLTESPKKLAKLAYNDPSLFCNVDGPLFRAMIVPLKNAEYSAVIFQGHHSLYDAISVPMFIEDLDQILHHADTPPISRIPYKFLAEMTYLGRQSISSQMSVNYHARKLQSIADHEPAFWPRQRTPGWFGGSEIGWPSNRPRPALDHPVKISGVNGIDFTINLNDLATLRNTHQIQDPVTFKAALALLTSQLTGHKNRSVFAQFQARRSWPFMHPLAAEQMPNPFDVDGPMYGVVLNNIAIAGSETILSFLTRLQHEQNEQTRHAHAPLYDICDKLSSADREAVLDNMHRHYFDWIPISNLANLSLKELDPVYIESRYDYGAVWIVQKSSGNPNSGGGGVGGVIDDDEDDAGDRGGPGESGKAPVVADKEVDQTRHDANHGDAAITVGGTGFSIDTRERFDVRLLWDDAQLYLSEAQDALQRYKQLIEWIARPENWGKKIGEVPDTSSST